MAELRKGLEQRQRERQAQQSIFESWFNHSLWLTTLLTALAGPLILLLLIATIGPCIINRIISFVRDQIGNVKLMIICQQYEALTNNNSDL